MIKVKVNMPVEDVTGGDVENVQDDMKCHVIWDWMNCPLLSDLSVVGQLSSTPSGPPFLDSVGRCGTGPFYVSRPFIYVVIRGYV